MFSKIIGKILFLQNIPFLKKSLKEKIYLNKMCFAVNFTNDIQISGIKKFGIFLKRILQLLLFYATKSISNFSLIIIINLSFSHYYFIP